MSNLSDIGFPVKSEQDVNEMLMSILKHLSQIPAPPFGFYYKFEDESGAQIFLQTNPAQEIIGFNPSFAGKSLRTADLIEPVERDTSELDGAFYARTSAGDRQSESSADLENFGFVFDVPDFRKNSNLEFPRSARLQICAFASNDLRIFRSDEEFLPVRSELFPETEETAGSDAKFFKPSSLPGERKSADAEDQTEESEDFIPPQAHAKISGRIKDFELKTNRFTNEKFYWFSVVTLGGEIDLVADANLIESAPEKDFIIAGSFWLSGKIESAE